MKRMGVLVMFLLLLNLVSAATLYDYDNLEMILNVNSSFELVPTKTSATLKSVSSEILLFPEEDFRQKLTNLENEGKVSGNTVSYEWNDKKIEKKEYGYEATIKTENKRLRVSQKIPFPIPLSDLKGYEQYLEETTTIDSENPQVIAKASELAEGEDDLFKVTFKLAEWVERNIKYDLNTLTATASQKASWVLQNRNGVCDEMTSLFVAMARSLGIPARFVSGISYSNSDLFDYPWQAHGWAEVYFPEIGWVSFDTTFGEYGYIDVTHIKLRDGFDPAEPATTFKWLANNVDLKTGKLDFKVSVERKGNIIEDQILLESEIHSSSINIGSYNLVKGIIKNRANHYAATTLKLAVPKEVEILGRNRRTILLEPKETRETYWVLKVNEELNPKYIYQLPFTIYSEKNVTITDKFSVRKGEETFTQKEINALTVQDEEKSYSRKISLTCDVPKEIMYKEKKQVTCSIKNTGNTNLKNVNFCVGKICEMIDLPINKMRESTITLKSETIGGNKLFLSVENPEIEKRTSFQYSVLDKPAISIKNDFPQVVKYGDSLILHISVDKTSFTNPKKVKIILDGPQFTNTWSFDELHDIQKLSLDLNSPPLGYSNVFTTRASWEDNEGKRYKEEIKTQINVQTDSFPDRIKMFFNSFLNLF